MVESLLEITRRVQKFYKPINVWDKYYRQDWGKHDFSCGNIFLG